MKNQRIFIACEASSRELLRHAVQTGAGATVCGEASDPPAISRGVKEHRPDILLMEISIPQPSVLEVIRQAREVVPHLQVVVCVGASPERTVREAWMAGARGFVLKDHARQQMSAAIHAVAENKSYVEAELAVQVLPGLLNMGPAVPTEPKIHHLTSREKEIIQLVAAGRTSKEIAASLSL